ncbi:MAG: bifunctional DNA-formamidopyrimidine glycosylase/DNA-(apurinic or apyrimidinic site) lyase [Pontiellaceae bacterium]|nr:bifunctional DNA-formamidopyrimidine glycosylase/DNA-(apurinic or apyrimidinic site) lyase [Pontiellaceae bacterium]
MPELPEVETIAQQLRAREVEGRQILSVRVNWPRTVEPYSVERFQRKLCGKKIARITRVGKWLMFVLSSGKTLMIHLRMSGAFSLMPGTHDRIILELSGGMMLYYSDPRKFGRWRLVDDPAEILEKLGPDALTAHFRLEVFASALRRRHRAIKPLLLDQSIVSGLGNIYVDEALWTSEIHPERPADSLSEAEVARLFYAIIQVLKTGVKNRGTSLGAGKSNYRDVDGEAGGHRDEVKVYGRSGTPCERCGTVLKKIVVAQRGTHFCPNCQPF